MRYINREQGGYVLNLTRGVANTVPVTVFFRPNLSRTKPLAWDCPLPSVTLALPPAFAGFKEVAIDPALCPLILEVSRACRKIATKPTRFLISDGASPSTFSNPPQGLSLTKLYLASNLTCHEKGSDLKFSWLELQQRTDTTLRTFCYHNPNEIDLTLQAFISTYNVIIEQNCSLSSSEKMKLLYLMLHPRSRGIFSRALQLIKILDKPPSYLGLTVNHSQAENITDQIMANWYDNIPAIYKISISRSLFQFDRAEMVDLFLSGYFDPHLDPDVFTGS